MKIVDEIQSGVHCVHMQNETLRCLGTDDSVNTCDCCGRTNLKHTVAFETESGGTVWYGVVCAAHALKSNAKAIRAAAKVADDEKAAAKRVADHAKWQESQSRWIAHLVSLTGGIKDFKGEWDNFKMIQALGGYAKAREGFAG